MCDSRDIATLAESRSKETGGPTITLYDQIPEGIGLSGRLYELHAEPLSRASAHASVIARPHRSPRPVRSTRP